VCDNAAIIKAAVDLLGKFGSEHLSCAAQPLNLTVTDTLKNNTAINCC
jgi:hypothetical protein